MYHQCENCSLGRLGPEFGRVGRNPCFSVSWWEILTHQGFYPDAFPFLMKTGETGPTLGLSEVESSQ